MSILNQDKPATREEWRDKMASVILGELAAQKTERDAEQLLYSLEATLRDRRDAVYTIDGALTMQAFFLRALGDVWEQMFASGWSNVDCDRTMGAAYYRAVEIRREERTKRHLSAGKPQSRLRGRPQVYDAGVHGNKIDNRAEAAAKRGVRLVRGMLHKVRHERNGQG